MIEEHVNIRAPDTNAILWRYMDFSKLIDLLESGSLFFVRAELMEDPYEAALPTLTENAYRAYFQRPGVVSVNNAADITLTNMRIMRTQSCISCWHENDFESAAMWSLYAKSDECIAIRTSFKNLIVTFSKAPELIHATQIQYIDYATQNFTNGDPSFSAFDAITHKRKSFEHEREVRLILWTHSSPNQLLTYGRQLDRSDDAHRPFPHAGHPVRVDTRTLLEAIYVSPRSPEWFRSLVSRVLKRYGIATEPVRSSLFDPPLG